MTRTETPQWLTLKQASELLGIHNTTLRSWADRGAIPVFRTPGGHRRFNASDLRRFLAARISETGIVDSHALVEIAVERVREQMGKLPPATHQWAISQDEEERTLRRRRGRQLFALALAYVMKPSQRQQIMEDGRKLGRDYGREAAQKRISLV